MSDKDGDKQRREKINAKLLKINEVILWRGPDIFYRLGQKGQNLSLAESSRHRGEREHGSNCTRWHFSVN